MKLKLTSKEKKGNVKYEAQIKKLFQKLTREFMEIYVLFYLCVFPLCMHDKYFDILSFRFELFWKPTFVYGVIFTVLGLLYLISDALYNGGAIRRRFLTGLKEVREKGNSNSNGFLGRAKTICRYLHISIVDIAITVLIILFAISTALAEYPYEAFWGDRGRNQGLLMWLMLYISYWLVTRFYKFKKWHIWAYLAGASAVCVWGILNFFFFTFGMFEHADDTYKYTFVSSIGNINTYNAFTGIFFGVSVGMFIKSKTILCRIFAFLAVMVASFGHIMGLSDNAVLSTGIVFIAAPLVLCDSYGHLSRYFVAVLTYLTALRITYEIKAAGIHTMADGDAGIQIKIAGQSLFIYVIVCVAIAAVLSIVMVCKSPGTSEISSEKRIMGRFKAFWIGIVSVVAGSIVIVLILANQGWHEEIWTPYKNILIFNDSWGTGRGLCWRLGMEFWRNDATFLMKLFGYGPDTFYIITMNRFMNIMQDAGYGMFDSAHNEYFEYFITVGILGLAAYISFLYTSLREMLSRGNDSSKIIAMGILAYALQAVVNIAIPITTPVFMIMLFAGITVSKIEKANS